jgi:hypothetical protein
VDWPKPVRRKIANINNFSTATKKSLKPKGSFLISLHMSRGVMWFEIMDLQTVSILPQIIVRTWVPETAVNFKLHLMLKWSWTQNSEQFRNSRENFQLVHFLEDIFELPVGPFRPSKQFQKADDVADISLILIYKLDSDLVFTF